MTDLNAYVPFDVLSNLTLEERKYLSMIFQRFDGYPSLAQLWQLMDEPWVDLGCDSKLIDGRVTAYYQHPVWMLNGLFIEQDAESLAHRHAFTDWIVLQAPLRVADFGGGFGGLARFVGQVLPSAQVEVVEPHPHPAAIALAASTPNVRFIPELTDEYDLLIATDVFEHVPDPLWLCAQTAKHLRVGGHYLMANCFHPVIKCHLPQLFHFEYGWDAAMQAMGLAPAERVQYGRAYQRMGALDLPAASKIGERARSLYTWVRHLPRGRAHMGALILKLFGKIT
ncbi:class I SAM-dependent methyltransferase [Methylicorpusculum sp.]|uniref:class I SAM-dependent methyltransferase n=1 Tax=Methylicorpusculum sp. TaxID=2713644 RepID=UPI0027310B0E|nr:class I SAM-dependent methyltransferase [Methylicorpusculum sp.]MDP2178678.1 class I SAM-dependent methyltransferase [Methylicorpusculum sp.]MDP3529563.1 class I SAM-dependent methyltransferase [Methylicorpusculum sp.]MDZ4154488.1 class I SAM-dependent methyltransferase [Methylicorpusculum sp.]